MTHLHHHTERTRNKSPIPPRHRYGSSTPPSSCRRTPRHTAGPSTPRRAHNRRTTAATAPRSVADPTNNRWSPIATPDPPEKPATRANPGASSGSVARRRREQLPPPTRPNHPARTRCAQVLQGRQQRMQLGAVIRTQLGIRLSPSTIARPLPRPRQRRAIDARPRQRPRRQTTCDSRQHLIRPPR